MKVGFSERGKGPKLRAAEAIRETKPEEFNVESFIPPEVWDKIRNYLPKTLRFETQSYEQAYTRTTYLCLACPEQCKDLPLKPEVEKRLQRQLAAYKREGQEGLWLDLLLCTRALFPEKREQYSVYTQWPELLEHDDLKDHQHGYWLKAGLLLNHPELREKLLDEQFFEIGKRMADIDSEFYTLEREYPLVIFSPEYRASIQKPPTEAMKSSLQALMKDWLRDQDSLSATLFLQRIVWWKMLTVEAIEFDGDKILFKEKKSTLLTRPPLPARPEV